MARIKDYINDQTINDEDKLLSSDGAPGPDLGRTKNIKVEDLKTYINSGVVGSDKNFVFTQIAASNVWVVDHNLGKFPAVTVVDSANTEVIGEIEHINQNQTRISFSASFGGKAYFN
jgi:hypothetical protein